MIVKHQSPIEFVNTSGCMFDEGDLEQAILWYSEKPVARKKKVFMHGSYPCVAIYKEKIHVHRLLMMHWEQRVLDSGEYVHHRDGNKLNAMKDNLEIMDEKTHQSYHNKGKKLSTEHREKISEANRQRAGKVTFKKRRQIPLHDLEKMLLQGYSINKIALHFGVDWSTIKNRIHENPELLEGGAAE